MERPASVVKELVENALDAGARNVHIEIEGGGATLVRVRDDGRGMSRADAELALERHATSKLRVLDDLQTIATHGFRGEALPSIAAVSELVLRTREEGSSAGTEIAVSHGRRHHVRDAGHPRGTTVEVRDLFGAVPARRKFLRAASTEAGHVAEAVTLLALARPQTGFFLKSGSRSLIEAPPVDGLAARLYQVFGAKLLEDQVPVEGGADWATVRGLRVPPGPAPARRGRRCGCSSTSARSGTGPWPRRCPRPTARREEGTGATRPSSSSRCRPTWWTSTCTPPRPRSASPTGARSGPRWSASVRAALEQGVRDLPSRRGGGPGRHAATSPAGRRPRWGRSSTAPPRPGRRPGALWGRGGTAPDRVAEGGPAAAGEASIPIVLGQHRLTYIVATDGEELVLVDQHTAHERVRFERLLERAGRHAVESQGLITPLVLELPPELRPVLDAHGETLGQLGFDVEAFGGASTRLRAVPAVLGQKDPGPALEGILRDLAEREEAEWAVAGSRDRLAATLACHSAVRAGQALNLQSMSAIVRDVLQTAHPTLCPHGRPTIVRVPRDEVSRWFGRTGWRRQ